MTQRFWNFDLHVEFHVNENNLFKVPKSKVLIKRQRIISWTYGGWDAFWNFWTLSRQLFLRNASSQTDKEGVRYFAQQNRNMNSRCTGRPRDDSTCTCIALPIQVLEAELIINRKIFSAPLVEFIICIRRAIYSTSLWGGTSLTCAHATVLGHRQRESDWIIKGIFDRSLTNIP